MFFCRVIIFLCGLIKVLVVTGAKSLLTIHKQKNYSLLHFLMISNFNSFLFYNEFDSFLENLMSYLRFFNKDENVTFI